jgi:hypothetical protein
MATELKACPFCGGKAGIREFANGHRGSGDFTANYEVGCEKCKIYFRYESVFRLVKGQPKFEMNGYDKCVEAWNRRAEDA